MKKVVLSLGLLAVLSLLMVGCQTGRVTGKAYDKSSTVDGKVVSRISFMQAMKNGECRFVSESQTTGVAIARCDYNNELAIGGGGYCNRGEQKVAISQFGYVGFAGALPGSIEAKAWQVVCVEDKDVLAFAQVLCCKR